MTVMLATIFAKSIRDRWLGPAIGALACGVMLLGAMAAYQTIDVAIYTDLPESLRSVMGIPGDADPATLAFRTVLGLLAGLTLAGVALSIGVSGVAGEERAGTMALLLSNPCSRRRVLLGKGAAMIALVISGGVVIHGAAILAPMILGVDIGDANILAVSVHLTLNALLFGALASAIGAATGDRTLASAATVGFMVVCYFLAGLLPLVDSVAGAAKWVPWYWFDGHDPLNNGLAVGYLSAQLITIGALAIVAWWSVDVRDLTTARGKQGLVADLIERVGSDEWSAKLLERLAGEANVKSVWAKAATQGRGLVSIVGIVMFAVMGLLMGPMYASLRGTLAEVGTELPETLLALAGGGDLSTPEGWYRLETFGLMAPIAVTLVAAAIGIGGLAGEERDRTMGLLLANPIPRSRIVVEKAIAMVVHTSIVGVAIFAGVAGGSLLAGLDLSIVNVAAAAIQATLLGVMFGAFGLMVGAATGSIRSATIGTLAAFGASYAANAVLAVSASLDRWTSLSPFDWYLGGEPLVNGIEWTSVGLLAACSGAFVAAAVAFFNRRDLRSG